ncbi:MAG: 8-amino-7-oxononanoate synthase [Vallitaleaceae bacterium]|jgi:8-amino-7-oxononanoate synthase|nr:8-amino-7-oxononanoate synthase [Vallitaleaceae bacterium]
MKNRYIETLATLKKEGNYRSLPANSDQLLDICSNDYLSLNKDIHLYNDFLEDVSRRKYKMSASSSRLLSGNSSDHSTLEHLVASSYQAEACLLFNSGYHANIGILPAIAGKNDLIIADKFVHASIIDGIQLSAATVKRYKHLDYTHLENILKKYRDNFEQVFIVSESIFSMDGDLVDLHQLVALKKKYKCFLYIDEAHAVGVRGKNGLGLVEEAHVTKEVDFIVGTFGKALASVGAYVVCSEVYKQYLVNYSRSLIFTTALPPINLAWTAYLFKLLPDFHYRREKLSALSKEFATLIGVKSESHIIPFIIGENKDAIAASQLLEVNGYNVLPIRYPTVPQGTARLRFSLNTDMKMEDLLPIKEILK